MPTLPFCKTCLDREWWKWKGRAILLPECACLLRCHRPCENSCWELTHLSHSLTGIHGPCTRWKHASHFEIRLSNPGDWRGDRQMTGAQVRGLPRSQCFCHWPWWAAGIHMSLAPQEMAVWMTDPCGGWGYEISIVIHPGYRSIVNREGLGLNTAGL